MCQVSNVVEYPEGFAIVTDAAGKYLVFEDTDRIEPLDEGSLPWGEPLNLKSLLPRPKPEDEDFDD